MQRQALSHQIKLHFDYFKDKKFAPKGAEFDAAVEYWKSLKSDDDAEFDAVVTLDASEITPQVTWGTNPGQVMSVDGIIPTLKISQIQSKKLG